MICNGGERATTWLRQVARHYVKYLYAIGKLDWDSYSRLLLTIPGRKYGRKLAQKPIPSEEVVKTLEILRQRRPDIHILYLLMLYSAVRFEHALEALKTWSPSEILYVAYLNRNISRLECLEHHCRYYMDRESNVKPAGFMFFPKWLLTYIEKYRNRLPVRQRVEKVVRKLGILAPKYIRTYALREMKRVFGETDVWRFVASKFGELSVSARHYMDLLEEADKIYPRYIRYIEDLLGLLPS